MGDISFITMPKKSCLYDEVQGIDFLSTYRLERDGRIKVKLLALHHFQNRKTIKEVADIVLVTEKTVSSWISDYVEFDYEGLIEREGRGRKPRLPVEEEDLFRAKLDSTQDERTGGSVTARDIQQILENDFDCNYSISGVYALLDRLNIVWITGRSVHPECNPDAIEEFKKSFPDRLLEIAEKYCTDKIEVWWQDEARVGQRGTLSRQWATKGTRPRIIRQQQYQNTYIYGAVCPEKDNSCGLVLPSASTGMMQIHLEEISKQVDSGFHAIVMMDQASWHTTEALVIPENISIMPLPPYSPELNPVEQVWQQLRRKFLSNRTFKDYDDVVQSCCDAWNCFCNEDGVIDNLCYRSWAYSGN